MPGLEVCQVGAIAERLDLPVSRVLNQLVDVHLRAQIASSRAALEPELRVSLAPECGARSDVRSISGLSWRI